MAENRFEDKLKELGRIVEELENGDVDLENMLALFENGIKLTKECTKELTDAEQKINILLKEVGGEMVEKPFAQAE